MKLITRWCIAAFLLWAAVSTAADSEINERIFSMPVSETEEVVIPWLEANGFEVFRATEALARVRLEAEASGRQWTIHLTAHSPLATRVVLRPHRIQYDKLTNDFWSYLDGYIKLPSHTASKTMQPVVPKEVRRQSDAVVCIYSGGEAPQLQVSGFVIDSAGYILSTAHDLKQDQFISVQFHDGRELEGRIIKLDHDCDLSLIRVNGHTDHIVPLDKGRYRPDRGETLFALDCPRPGLDGIQRGTLDGPPRQVQGQILWQVRMHIEPGSSGSPILDDQGRLIGVIKGRYRGTNTVGFVIPFETIGHFLGKDSR